MSNRISERLRCCNAGDKSIVSALFFAEFSFPFPGLNGFMIIGAGLLAAGLTFLTNWLALIPWRSSRDELNQIADSP